MLYDSIVLVPGPINVEDNTLTLVPQLRPDLTVDGYFNPVNYPFGGAFFNNHPTYAGIVDQTIDGQAMVKVPKFWFKTGTVPSGTYAGKRYWMISDQPAPGFAVHPAFMNYGAEVAQYWVGKYQGTNVGGRLAKV